MRLPEWEPLYAEGLVALNLPQPRRGINLRSLLDTLLLENKYKLIGWAFENSRILFPASHARRILELFGLDTSQIRQRDETLSARQWETFRERVEAALHECHRRYKRAQTVLFRRYQSLLHNLVNRQVFDPEKRPDAFQEASIGLIHAIDKVEDSSASLGSYARTWISRHIRNYLMEQHFPVHVPINLASKILRYNDNDGNGNGEDRSDEAENLQSLAKPGISIEEMAEGDDHAPQQLADDGVTMPSESFTTKDMHHILHQCLDKLTDKQREVLALRYGLGKNRSGRTLAGIASEVGISHQQVSMREKRALQKLEAVMRPLYDEICD